MIIFTQIVKYFQHNEKDKLMSFTFDQVAEFKVGETYWENSQGGCYQFEVSSPVEITDCRN